MAFWQQIQVFTLDPLTGTADMVLTPGEAIERLTIWAISGFTLTNVTMRPRLNGVNYGTATVFIGARAGRTIFTSGGASKEDLILPANPAVNAATQTDPLVFSVNLSNAGATAAAFTLMACAAYR